MSADAAPSKGDDRALSVLELVAVIHERGMTLTYDAATDRLNLAADGATIPAAIISPAPRM